MKASQTPLYAADFGGERYVSITGRCVRAQLRDWGIPALWLRSEGVARLRRDRLPDLRAAAEVAGVRLVERVGTGVIS